MKNQSPARRILVVDDNRDAADMLADLLTMFGHVAVPVYGEKKLCYTLNCSCQMIVF